MSIEIYTDSSSNLFPSLLKEKKLNIHVLPMTLLLDQKEYHCYQDEDIVALSKDYYSRLDPKKKNAKTSLIAPGVYYEAFKEEAEKGNQVFCLSMAKGVSGNYQSAMLAKDQVNQEFKKEMVYVLDSQTASFGLGSLAIEAYQKASSGMSFEDLIKDMEERKGKLRSEFTVDDLSYLLSAGRISPLIAKVANLLHIKVLLKSSNESKIALEKKAHGRKMALKSMIKTCLDHIRDKNQVVYITHCDCLEDATSLKKGLEEGGIENISIHPFDLITGTHLGKGGLALFYYGENKD